MAQERIQKRIGSGFYAKSEPEEVLNEIDLENKIAVVTGGYSGIGLETTRALASKGMRVFVPARRIDLAENNLADVPGDIVIRSLNLSDLGTVEKFVTELSRSESRIDILINNAGVMACPEFRVSSGWESQFAINHLGHFALTTQMLPLLMSSEAPRVVCLSSVAHKRAGIQWDDIHFERTPYDKWLAYAQAKSANALFALYLDERYSGEGLRAFSVHPGGILTPLQRYLKNTEMEALGWTDAEGNLSENVASLFKSVSQGAATSLWAATSSQLDGLGGLYCEDCDVADGASKDSPSWSGVSEWVTSLAEAERLWEVSERLINQCGMIP